MHEDEPARLAAAARALVSLLSDPDPVKASRVMQAMMPMSRIDIATLERAYAG